MYNLPFLQVAKKRMGGPSSVGTAKKQKPASGTADIDDLNGIRMPAGGATGAAGKRPAAAPKAKQGRATEEELELLSDLKDTRAGS